MKKSLACYMLLPASALFLSACSESGDSPEEPTPTVTVTETQTVTAEPQEPEDEDETDADVAEAAEESPEDDLGLDFGRVGDTVNNYGVDMTLHEAYSAETIPWNDSGYRPGSDFYEITPLPAESGGKWFVVETSVENVGSTSMDLTCSWPIDVVAVDVEEREFDTIRSLHQYEDNPRCNDNLQPGFSAEMVYVFSVPEDAEMMGVAFRDTEESGWGDYSVFIFEDLVE